MLSLQLPLIRFQLQDLTLFDLITGHYGLNDLSGPVGTVSIIAETTSQAVASGAGFDMIIYIMALISINVGVFNLLPIPALDGGRLFFILIEAIRRKPLKEELEIKIQLLGFSILIALSLYVTYNDIVRIFG